MLFNVYDKESAKMAYKAIKMFSELNDPTIEGIIAETKRNVREWSHRERNRRIIKDYGIDGFVELVAFPDDIDSEESADDYFRECIYREYYNSPFDCTGQAFTDWYKLFERNGRFYAYHSVSVDV